jgi:hypothetical protein
VFAVSKPALGLAIRFPAPFSLTLNGAISLGGTANSVTFTGVPDIPLSSLIVSINGGPNALFASTCATPSGTLSGTFAGQNGASANSSTTVTVAGCPTSGGGPTPGVPAIGSGVVSGLGSSKPHLGFKLSAGKNAPKLTSFSVKLPSGLSFVAKHVAKGVSLSGAKVKSAKVSHGKLVVTLKSAATSFGVKIGSAALSVSKGLAAKVRGHRLTTLAVIVTTTDASGKTKSLTLTLSKLK